MRKIALIAPLILGIAACDATTPIPDSELDAAPPYPKFTSAEKRAQVKHGKLIAKTAASCLEDKYETHVEFYDRHGVSKFYGERRKQHQTRAGLIKELKRFGKPASLVSQLEPTSCISLALQCLKSGFRAADQLGTYKKIMKYLKIDNKVYGTDLQNMLRNLGWKTMYWNPKPSSNEAWDRDDRQRSPAKPGRSWNPVWGGHAYRYNTVMRKNLYYNVKIDDKTTLVDFGKTQPASFKEHKFFIGIAHAGYHVFPGTEGRVIEAHSTRLLNSRNNLEFSAFNPLASGGGPRWTRTERYRSGVIVVPPRAE